MTTSHDDRFAHAMPAVRQMMEGLYGLCQTHGLIPFDNTYNWCRKRIGRQHGLCYIIKNRPGILTEALNELMRRGLLTWNDKGYLLALDTPQEEIQQHATA